MAANKFVFLYLLPFVFIGHGSSGLSRSLKPNGDDQQQQNVDATALHTIHSTVLHLYNRHIRPGIGMDRELICNFSMIITHLDEVDEEQRAVHMHGWIILQWYDERLAWNGKNEFQFIEKIILPLHSIWHPDIHLYNNAQSMRSDVDALHSSKSSARIRRDGHVTIDPAISLRAYCEFEYSRFPWDEQQCTVSFGSWAYRTRELKWRASPRLTRDPSTIYGDSHRAYQTNWRITNASLLLSDLEFENELWNYINVIFTLRRGSSYAAGFILVPAAVHAVLTIVAFLFSHRGQIWKMTLIVSSLVLGILHLLSLRFLLPAAVFNGSPKIVTLCTATVLSTSIALFLACAITALSRHPCQAPTWFRNIFNTKLVKILCCCLVSDLDDSSTPAIERNNYHQQPQITKNLSIHKPHQAPLADCSECASSVSSLSESFRSKEGSRQRREDTNGQYNRRRSQQVLYMMPSTNIAVILDRMICCLFLITDIILWVMFAYKA